MRLVDYNESFEEKLGETIVTSNNRPGKQETHKTVHTQKVSQVHKMKH